MIALKIFGLIGLIYIITGLFNLRHYMGISDKGLLGKTVTNRELIETGVGFVIFGAVVQFLIALSKVY